MGWLDQGQLLDSNSCSHERRQPEVLEILLQSKREGDRMHREQALEKVTSCTYEELEEWRKHVLFCLKWHRKDQNQYEIDDCEFLLEKIEEQIAHLDARRRLGR